MLSPLATWCSTVPGGATRGAAGVLAGGAASLLGAAALARVSATAAFGHCTMAMDTTVRARTAIRMKPSGPTRRIFLIQSRGNYRHSSTLFSRGSVALVVPVPLLPQLCPAAVRRVV